MTRLDRNSSPTPTQKPPITSSQNRELSRFAILFTLFWEFFKIAALVVGGGYAILLVAEDVFTKRLKWLKENELMDMLVLIQSVPGLIAGNIAIFIGYRKAGLLGALAALFGIALPSYLVITIIAAGIAYVPTDSHALELLFRSVRSALSGLMLVTFIRMWKQTVRDIPQLILFLACTIAIVLFKVSPGWLILAGVFLGPIYCFLICSNMPKTTTK